MTPDDWTTPPAPERDPERSLVGRLPREIGDEVDDARLIARLHAAIEKETGRFGLPWWQTPWVRGLMGTAALVVVAVIGIQVGRDLGPASPDRAFIAGDPALRQIFQTLDTAYSQDPTNPLWDQSLDAVLDRMGQHYLETESRGLFTADPAQRQAQRAQPASWQM